MDFLHKCSAVLFLLSSYTVHASDVPSTNPGIAFVHGTNDHRTDADGGYWKRDFIDTVALGQKDPSNTFVVHCDFSHYMWKDEAAGCVTEQLLNFIKEKSLTSLTVYAHSDGGNVMRWILSNPTYDEQNFELAQKITKVVAIAPSSGGTPLADEVSNGGTFEAGVGWLLGYKTSAVKQQRIGDMALFNNEILFASENRPSLYTPFKVIVGSDVTASPINSNSYCNGYWLNAALKITKSYLDTCADGFLTCQSQATAGDVWFYDVEKTDNYVTLSHNQSRHSCSGLERILKDDLFQSGEKA